MKKIFFCIIIWVVFYQYTRDHWRCLIFNEIDHDTHHENGTNSWAKTTTRTDAQYWAWSSSMRPYKSCLASFRVGSTMISQALRIHESTVARHLSDYALSEKFKPENGGSQSLLSDTQTIQLIEHLTEKTYFHTRQSLLTSKLNSVWATPFWD